MIYYHIAPEQFFKHYLRWGFMDMRSIREQDSCSRHGRHFSKTTYDPASDCCVLAFSSPEDAYYWHRECDKRSDVPVLLAIEGEFDTFPIKGTMVPDGTVKLKGEISPQQISHYEPAPAPAM
jgi:hypothetical protein